jgi:tetratricopeptide (TPR) repeat protein
MERIASLFFSLGDFDGATRWLERADVISPDAGIWLRELILRAKGDTERAVEYVQQHADRIDAAGAWSTLEGLSLAESRVADLRGDWPTLYTISAAFLDHSKPDDMTNAVFNARPAMALAADRLGRSEERDRLLAVQQQHLDRLRQSGVAHSSFLFQQALTSAIGGDAKATSVALELAYGAGALGLPLARTAPEFEKVRDSDEIRTLLERIDEQNAARLERLLEVERELGDFAGEPEAVQETRS